MNLKKLKSLLDNSKIEVIAVHEHSKASESYVELVFKNPSFKWEGFIPYYYRRAGLMIETEEMLAEYLIKIHPNFTKEKIINWTKEEKKYWKVQLSKQLITKPFFDELIKLKWTSKFPANDNPQRRIQAIKDLGYTVSSKRVGRKMERLLVPIPRSTETGYETISNKLKLKAIKALEFINSYELSSANKAGLLPDHKFPEIRWDEKTREKNSDDITETEIKNKFQLLDNQRNQQKREVCRECFQTGKRGKLFGVNYFYSGDENWSAKIPKVGKDAEEGCVGCGWYDIQKWRENLNEIISKNKK